MASNADDTFGCIAMIAIGAFGAWWLAGHYEVRKRGNDAPARPASAPAVIATQQYKPTGQLPLGVVAANGSWSLNADALSGPRTARQVWVEATQSKGKPGPVQTESLYRVNCDTGAFRTLTVVEYAASGKPINQWGEKDFADEASYAVPGSNMGAVMKAACDPVFDTPAK